MSSWVEIVQFLPEIKVRNPDPRVFLEVHCCKQTECQFIIMDSLVGILILLLKIKSQAQNNESV